MVVPPEVRSRRVPGASAELAALVAEPPAGAPARAPALLVPGYTGSKEDFLPVLAPLARAGHRCVAVDLAGQYESPGPDDPQAYTVAALAKDVAALLSWLGEPAHLVGHSFGGLVARRTVLDGTAPRSLTLLGSGPGAIGGRRAQVIPLMSQVLEDGGIEALAAAAADLDRQDPRVQAAPPEVAEFLNRRWLAAAPLGVVVMGREITSAPDEVDALAAVDLPVLVAHGVADDAWTPAEQQVMATRLDARYEVIDDSVHSPACEAPEATARVLLDFWSSVDGSRDA